MMKLPHLISFLFVCAFFQITTGASDALAESPSDIVREYLTARERGNLELAYEYISAKDKAIKSVTSFSRTDKGGPESILPLGQYYSFQILDEAITGDTASVTVEETEPDRKALVRLIMQNAFKNASAERSEEEIKAEVRNILAQSNVPTIKKTREFKLLQEEGYWKVYLDLAAEAQNEENQSRYDELLVLGKHQVESKRYKEALDTFQQAVSLVPNPVEAEKAVVELKRLIGTEELKRKYTPLIRIYDLKADYYEAILDGKVPGVMFKIKNEGNRTLKMVEVTVYFKDREGVVIFEQQYRPVNVSQFNMGDNNPLKPNYIRQLPKDKFYKAEGVPTEWKKGSVEARITDIEFFD